MTGHVRGIRTWQIVVDDLGNLRLAGLNGILWQRGEPTRAKCTLGRHSSHAPSDGCTCGLYAAHPWADTEYQRAYRSTVEVAGLVRAWGCIHLHKEGFRAQLAEPAWLFLIGLRPESEFGRLLERLARDHGAELRPVPSWEAIPSLCRVEGVGLSSTTVANLLTPDPASHQG